MTKIQLGYIARAHGVRGELRVHVGSDAICGLERIFVGEREMRVVATRPSGDAFLLRLEGVGDRDQAEALSGQPVFALREELPAAGDGEVYVADLVGCEVVDEAGAPIGVVTSTYPTAAHEILVLRRPDGKEAMVPMVPAIVTSVDIVARRLVCAAPPGMLDGDEP